MLQILAVNEDGTTGPYPDVVRGSFNSRAPAAFNSQLATAPASGAVIADTGPLSAGTYLVFDSVENSANANSIVILLVERNPANSADVATSVAPAIYNSGTWVIRQWLVQVLQGERLVLRTSAAAAAGEKYQSSIAVFPL